MAQVPATPGVSRPKSGENVWLWLVKIVSGPLLVILLGIHLIVNHFLSPGGLLTYADIVAYYKNPVIPAMEIAFLATVVTHSLTGLRGIVLDLKPSPNLMQIVNSLLIALGLASLAYGIWLILTIARM